VELIYSQATVENLANKPLDAIRSLREALTKGYPLGDMQADPELENLRSRPEFQALIKEYSSTAR